MSIIPAKASVRRRSGPPGVIPIQQPIAALRSKADLGVGRSSRVYSSNFDWTGGKRLVIIGEMERWRRRRGRFAEEKGLLCRVGDGAARRRRYPEFDDLQPGNIDAYGPGHVSVHSRYPFDLRRHPDLHFGIDDASRGR